MGACDNILVDLSPVDFDVALTTSPCFDVEIVQAGVTMSATSLAGQGPPGPKGDKGDQGGSGLPGVQGPPGSQGLPGTPATIAVGSTVTGAPGSAATVTNSGSQAAAVFNFSVPAGVQGAIGNTGPIGNAATVAVGTTTTGSPGTNAAVNNSGSSSAAVFNFTIPAGVQGPQGIQGPQGPTGPGTGDMLKSVYDINADNIVDHAALADTAPWTGISGKPTTFTPSTHETTHLDNGSDPIPLATTARTGLSPQIPATNPTKQFHRGDNTYSQANYPDLTNLPTSFNPSAHEASHVTGGSDIIPIATSSATGLVPALPADTTKFLRGDGTFARTAVSTDAGNLATLGSDSLIVVPQSSIWSARLRSFQALGNNTFEVDQRTAGSGVTISSAIAFGCDRWKTQLGGTMVATAQQVVSNTVLPGTNFFISRQIFRITLSTQQTSLGANDFLLFGQSIEGPQLRELYNDVHSMSILVRSSVASLNFGISLTDPTGTRALGKLCTTSATPNAWTLIPLANLPAFPPAGTFALAPGTAGYVLNVCLAGGTSRVMPANDTWQSTATFIPAGIDNFASKPINSTIDIAYISHEPGALYSNPPMDCPFTTNLEACQRYFQKSVPYGSLPLSGTSQHIVGCLVVTTVATTAVRPAVAFKKTLAKPPTAILQYNGVANTAYLETIGSVSIGSVTASDSEITGITLASSQTVAANNIPNLFGGWYADTGW